MKMIKPIVNVSKIVDDYDTFVVGFNGVLSDGFSFNNEAISALINLKKIGKKIVLVSNTPKRVSEVLNIPEIPAEIWDAVVTAGEVAHYKLKAKSGKFAGLGEGYYVLGAKQNKSVFAGLDYQEVNSVSRSDFMYMSAAAGADDKVDNYLHVLEHAANLSLKLLCIGNDTSQFFHGQIALAPGMIAEQYAIMGGEILTVGKPDANILRYSLDNFENTNPERVLLIGDSLATDIKGANLAGISSMLVSKGIHVNFLGEGYIPDISKARELSSSFEAYPDFVISGLRW